MGFLTKSGWIFLVIVIISSIGIVDYVKNDSFFGLYSFEEDGFTIYESDIEVYFCPEDDCANQLIEKINSANESIDVAIYSFTLDNVADALVKAQDRNVKVRVIFDYLQASADYSIDEEIENEGIEIKIRKGSGSMHNKFIIIDGEKVMTGSFNYSNNANTKNDENLIFILNKTVAKNYLAEFNEIWQQSSIGE